MADEHESWWDRPPTQEPLPPFELPHRNPVEAVVHAAVDTVTRVVNACNPFHEDQHIT